MVTFKKQIDYTVGKHTFEKRNSMPTETVQDKTLSIAQHLQRSLSGIETPFRKDSFHTGDKIIPMNTELEDVHAALKIARIKSQKARDKAMEEYHQKRQQEIDAIKKAAIDEYKQQQSQQQT